MGYEVAIFLAIKITGVLVKLFVALSGVYLGIIVFRKISGL